MTRNDRTLSASPQRIAFLGDFLPRLCGIATFTHDLCEAVSAVVPSAECYAVAVNDREEGYAYSSRVHAELFENDLATYRRAADYLNFNNADVLCVQHEFGIYGGPAGSHLLALLEEVRMPVVTTLHTVLHEPDVLQRKLMKKLLKRSDRVIVMAEKGREILVDTYALALDKIDVIPHGIPDVAFTDSEVFKGQFGVHGREVLMTFGLLGPGKGIEFVIKALPEITRRFPNVVYLILGATHPQLVAHEGESYRLSLERLAEDLGVKEHVIFYNGFVSKEDLNEFIGATDIYLTPYLNEAQITSGTLAYVFGAGRAVVSTPYWHAQELLSDDRGVLVPFRDPKAIAHAVIDLLDDPDRMAKTRETAYHLGREMIWPAVACRYVDAFRHAFSDLDSAPRAAFADWTLAGRPFELPRSRLDHIVRMSDGTGIFQHAIFNVPDFVHGYCTDDNARAFILCNMLDDLGGKPTRVDLESLATRYLAFLASALNRDSGRFRNFMSHQRQWLEETGSEDSHGRALWALGTGVGRSRNRGRRRLSADLFEIGLPAVRLFTSPRAWAFTLIGIHGFLREHPDNTAVKAIGIILTDQLLELWERFTEDDWRWFESYVTYDNARICQALLLCSRWMPDPLKAQRAHDIALESLRWLASIQTSPSGCFRPIGSNGFYSRGGVRADFDQQPVEAQAMVSACLEAFQVTQEPIWTLEARRAFDWFLGRNDLGLPLYDSGTGGCGDGLHADRVNENQGAESSLAFHLALVDMKYAEHPLPHR